MKHILYRTLAISFWLLAFAVSANAAFSLKHRMGIVELPAGEGQDALFLKSGQQVVHTDSIIMYATKNATVPLPRPDKKAYTTYVRWYNYDTDDAIALIDRYTAAGDTAKRCNINNAQGKFRIGYLNKDYSFETKYTTYPADRVIRIAADQSAYGNYDWIINGEDTTFIEPTLSRRRIYVFRPAREMAQKIYACTNNDNYLEVHKMMAPTGRQLYLGPDYAIIDKNLTWGNYYYFENNNPDGAAKRMASDATKWSWKIEDGEKVYLNGNSTIDENTIINGQYKSASSDEPGTITYYLQYTNGSYTYNIAKFIVTYVTASNIGPSTSVSSPEPTSKMELLYEQNFNFNRPGTTSPEVKDGGQPTYYTDGHLPVNESSYGCFYQDIAFIGGPSAGIRPNKVNKDLTSGEYGICNWQDFYNLHTYIYNHVEGHENYSQEEAKEDAREGYFLYVDGSDLQGEVFSLEVNADLCPGSTMYFYAWLIDASNNGGTRSAPNMDFIVIGEDEDGTEHILTTYTTGEFGVNARDNTDTNAKKRGEWYQVMFPVSIDVGNTYPRYELKIMNKGRTNDGNDFAIDDIRVYAQRPPVMPLQASTSECVDQASATITAYLRIDYQEIDYEGTSLFFQWRDENNNILRAEYYNMDSTDNKSTVFGRIPVKQESELTDADKCASLLDFDSQFRNTETTVIRYIEEKINLMTTRYVMYIAMPIEVRPNHTYTGFVSPLLSHLGSRNEQSCGTFADLYVSGGTRITINDEITTEETVHVCGHRTYDLNIVLTQVVQDYSTENLKVDTFRCKADWLVGGPEYVNDHQDIYHYTFDQIQDYLGFYHQDPNHPVAKAAIEYLMRQGLLFLDTFGISMTPELSLSYTAFPRGQVILPGSTEPTNVCSVPRFLHIQPAEPGSNMMVVGKDASEYAGLPDVVKNRPRIIRISDAQRREGWFNVPLYRIGDEESYIIDRVYAISSTDPNWRSIALVSDHDEMRVKDTIHLGDKENHNDPINTAIQSLKPGYDYTFHVAFVGESDEDRCDRGHTYFTLRIVPDSVTWLGGDWNTDVSWDYFTPLDTTNVILQAQNYNVSFADNPAESFDFNYTRNKCRNIYIPAGASMAGQENVEIRGKAYVDIPVPAQKWALTSIPIKGIVSGDLFVSQNESTEPFTVAHIVHGTTEETAFDRYTYEVYDSPFDATTNTWQRPDSTLDRPIRPNDAVMVGIDCASAAAEPVIRLPKPDNYYHYFDTTTHNWIANLEDIHSDLRADLGKPAWNGNKDIALTPARDNLYLLGNPTFGYIDLTQLMAENEGKLTGKYYVASDGINALPGSISLSTIDPSAAHVLLPPCRGVLLEGNGTNPLTITINISTAPANTPTQAPHRALQYAASFNAAGGMPIAGVPSAIDVLYEISEESFEIEEFFDDLIGQTPKLKIYRTLYKDGGFNTLCLPFDLDASEIAAAGLENAEIYSFTGATGDYTGMECELSPVTTMEAGVPYILRWTGAYADGSVITELNFTNATIQDKMGQEVGSNVKLVGHVARDRVSDNANHSNLFIGTGATLNWPKGNDQTYMKGFRAHFTVPTSGPLSVPKGTPARLVIRAHTPTDINPAVIDNQKNEKIMVNGMLYILRAGQVYNAQGQKVK